MASKLSQLVNSLLEPQHCSITAEKLTFLNTHTSGNQQSAVGYTQLEVSGESHLITFERLE